MSRILSSLTMLASIAATSGNALAAGDADAGKTKSTACGACHGAHGLSTNDAWPSLAGQKSTYLVLQLKAFRDGTRKDPVMAPLATPLSDADIDNLAAYFSTQTASPSVY